MHVVTKTFEWSMAHRLIQGYKGKCKNIHGHTYKAEITVEGPIDPKQFSMVVDFSDISNTVKKWVNDNLDHGMVVAFDDLEMIEFLKLYDQKHYVLPPHLPNSTAENISCLLGDVTQYLLREARKDKGLDPNSVQVCKVVVWETPTSGATWLRCCRTDKERTDDGHTAKN